jgi:hypothetical protein
MRNVVNYVLFQAGWLACVGAALDGYMWLGPITVLGIVVLHLTLITKPERRRRELALFAGAGALGMLADSLLAAIGLVTYPTSAEARPFAIAPPWIIALWVLFATLPAHSLGWLQGRLRLAALLGAIGGPLSFLAGERLGAIGTGSTPIWTWIALSIEYAICMPLLLHFSGPPPPVGSNRASTTAPVPKRAPF